MGLIPELGRFPGERISTQSSILAWEIPGTEETGGLQSMGLKESDTTEKLNMHAQYMMGNMISGEWLWPVSRGHSCFSPWDSHCLSQVFREEATTLGSPTWHWVSYNLTDSKALETTGVFSSEGWKWKLQCQAYKAVYLFSPTWQKMKQTRQVAAQCNGNMQCSL